MLYRGDSDSVLSTLLIKNFGFLFHCNLFLFHCNILLLQISNAQSKNNFEKKTAGRNCAFLIRRLRSKFGIVRLPKPQMDIFRPHRPKLIFPDFADKGNLSANEEKITAIGKNNRKKTVRKVK